MQSATKKGKIEREREMMDAAPEPMMANRQTVCCWVGKHASLVARTADAAEEKAITAFVARQNTHKALKGQVNSRRCV